MVTRKKTSSKKRQPNRQNWRNKSQAQIRDTNSVLLVAPETTVTNTTYPFLATVVKFNVAALANTGAARLASFLDLYDEFRFTRLRFRWEPALPSTTTGQIAMYYDPDPQAETPSNFVDVSGNKYLSVSHVARSRRLVVPPQALRQARYNWFTRKSCGCDGTQGCLVLAISAGTVPHAQGRVTLGSLWLDYDVTVRAPTSKGVNARNYVAPPQHMDEILHQDAQRIIANTGRICTSTTKMSNGMVYDEPGRWAMRTAEGFQVGGIKPPTVECANLEEPQESQDDLLNELFERLELLEKKVWPGPSPVVQNVRSIPTKWASVDDALSDRV